MKAFRLLVNRSVNWADWDSELLSLELLDLKELDFDLTLTGFDTREIDELLLSDEPDAQKDAVPDLPENPATKTGDLWLCGPHRVLCGDSCQENAVSRLCGPTRPNLMATDPPYGVSYDPSWRVEVDSGGRHAVGKVTNDDQVDWTAALKLFAGDVAYVWHAGVHAGEVAALRFIDGARDGNPFFLAVSYFDPHPPYMAPSEYTSRYHSDQMKIPPYIAPSLLGGRLDDYCRAMKFDKISDTDLTETMRYYFASIEGMVDHQVGRIMTALSTKGLIENTVVLFTADHGDFMGHHRAVRKAMFLYDALLHVPMIWHAPGIAGRGGRTAALAQGIDIFPTLVDLTGGKPDGGLLGRSLKPILAGNDRSDASRTIFTSAGYGEWPRELVETNRLRSADPALPLHTLVEDGSEQLQYRQSMLRTWEWKLLLSESRPPELYRMNGGWIERKNVADEKENAGVRRDLETRLTRWWQW